MTKSEENKLSMLEAVYALLQGNTDKTATIPAFAEGETGLQTLIQKIKDTNSQFKNLAAGKTATKHAAEDSLVEAVLEVSNSLFVIARRNKDEELKVKAGINISDLRGMRDTELAGKCQDIATSAADMADELVNYGITADKLTELNNKIAAYQTALGAQESGLAERTAARQALSDLFKQTDELLKEELDSLMELFRNSETDFYNQYQAARVIRDLGIRHGTNTDPAQPSQ